MPQVQIKSTIVGTIKTIVPILVMLLPIGLNAQYTETFAIDNKGILSGTCGTNDPTSCASFDFTGVDWTIGGDLSGIDSEGLSTTGGYLLAEDVDEEACWISPTLDISGVASASLTIDFTIPVGAVWENSTSVGSIDYADVKYSIDGGAFVTLANVNGCPGSGHTISASSCGSGLTGPLTFNPTVSGLVGSTLDIQVCFDTNTSTDDGHLENVSVPEAGVMVQVPLICPTVGAVSASETTVCANEAFNVTATGLATMDAASNMVQDFGIEFVYFGSATADPYTGGTSLATVPFGSLTGGGTTAAAVGVSIPFVDPTGFIYAILSPTPGDATCRPSAVTTIATLSVPSVDVTLPETYCVDAGTVTGGPLVAPTAPSTVYSGANVTDNGDNMSFEFDVAAAGVGVHPVTVTLTGANGCMRVEMVNVTVTALPTVGFTAPADLCLNDGVQNNLGGGTPPQGTVTGDMGVYMGTGVTDDGNGLTYDFDPAAAGVGTHVITYTYTDENGCTNSASDMVEVFAIPNAMFTAPADICVNAGVQTNLGGGTPTGGTYGGPGVADDGNGMTYAFDPAAAGVGVHNITYTVGVAGCSDSAMDAIEVFALPTVTMEVGGSFCIDDAASVVVPLVSPTGGVFSGMGVTDNGNGMTFTFNPAMAGAGTITVTYTYTDPVTNCSNFATGTLTVNALPTVGFTAPADLCLNAGVQNNLGGGTPPQGTVTGDMGMYMGSGVTDDGNGLTYDFDPAVAGVGVHNITYTYTDENGCTNSASDMVEVFAIPNTMFTAPADVCLTDVPITGLSGGTPTGGTYMGPGVIDDGNGMTFTFEPGTAGVGVHNITYTVTVAGCSTSAMDNIEVFALPVVSLDVDGAFCINDAASVVTPVVATPSGGEFSGMGVTDNSNGMDFTFNPAMAGSGTITVTYTYVDPATNCSNSATDTLTVNNLPIVGFTAPADLCLNAGVQNNLGGGTPPEGTAFGDMGEYMGPGVTDDGNGLTYDFDPAVAGVGVHNIIYTYTNQNGCTNSASDMVEVFALPTVMFTAPTLAVCVDDPVVTGLGGGTPAGAGGIYSGVGVADDGNGMTFSFNPMASAPAGGNITVTYMYTDANGCTASASDDIFVNPICCLPPTITCPADNFGLPAGCNPAVPAGTTNFNIVGGPTPNPAWPTVADGCAPLVLTFMDAITDVGCNRTVTRTYRITDDNGDFAECDQVFTFTFDTTPPVFDNPPASTTLECDAVPPAAMVTASDNCVSIEPFAMINEIHYDNTGADVGEFIEIVGTAGIDLAGYQLLAYDSDNLLDAQLTLSGVIPNEGAGFGAVAFFLGDLNSQFFENGPSEGRALMQTGVGVVDFISYEGVVTAANGPAVGMTSVNIGTEPGTTPVGQSLQQSGTGCNPGSFTWGGPSAASPGTINAGQTFDLTACTSTSAVGVTFVEVFAPGNLCPQEGVLTRTWTATDACGNMATHTQTINVEDTTAPVFCDAPTSIDLECDQPIPPAPVVTAFDNCDLLGAGNIVWVNEFHYDNVGTDAGEFIEIAGLAGTDLTGYTLALYNGFNGLLDEIIDLSGVIPDESCNIGALSFATPGLMNGSPDGFALVLGNTVLEFLSYEGTFMAVDGPAMNMTSVNVGVSEPGTTPVGQSLQLTGTGSNGTAFAWSGPAAESPGFINAGQTIQGNVVAVLNEVTVPGACAQAFDIVRTWTATDACGNMAVTTQVISVDDTVPPVVTCPPTEIIEGCDVGDIGTGGAGPFCDQTQATAGFPSDPGCEAAICAADGFCCSVSWDGICAGAALIEPACTGCLSTAGNTPPFSTVLVNITEAEFIALGGTVVENCNIASVTYIDTQAGTCPIVVNRVYTLTDDCGNIDACNQTILIDDTVAPIITCPPTANIEGCDTDAIAAAGLPAFSATSAASTEAAFIAEGGTVTEGCNVAAVTYVDVAIGTCPIVVTRTYTLTDDCGNSSSCDQLIVIDDTTAPALTGAQNMTVECDGAGNAADLAAWLASNGGATATDDCGFVWTNNFVALSDDCGATGSATVTFTATDPCGNVAPTTATFTISDTQAPVITCPPSQFGLTCNQNPPAAATTFDEFIAQGGTITEGCTPLNELVVVDMLSDNGGTNCPGDGLIITRTYTVIDDCGNASSCDQTFTYIASTTGPVITSVAPTCYKYCADLANPMESDITFDTDCNFGGTVSITGPTQIGPSNCQNTIYRYTYTVTDDCGRVSAPVSRDFVIGNEGPTIECQPFNLILECDDPNNDDYIATHLSQVNANASCDLGVTITNNFTGLNFTSCTNSTKVVTFTATDDCGRTATCTTTITLQDNTAPELTSTYEDGICNEAICGSNVNFWFNEWMDKVEEGLSATDQCDNFVTFTTIPSNPQPNQDCPDNEAETVVTWVANDNCGNTTTISYSFYVVPAATPAPTADISGMINTEMDEAVEAVEVTLSGGASFFEMMTTANDGIYSFTDVPLEQNYQVTPYLNQNPLNGVSSFDLILIAQHILGISDLDSPYKMIAADVNSSGSITTLDILELRKLILLIETDFPNNTSWRFVEGAFVFPNPTNPFASSFPEVVDINGLLEDVEHDFIGVKIGDVNNSAIPNNLTGGEDRSFNGDLHFNVNDKILKAGDTYEVAFTSDNFEAVAGYQYTLNFDASQLEYVSVEAGDLAGMSVANFGLDLTGVGAITTSWTNREPISVRNDAELFSITFKAKSDVQLSEALFVSSRFTAAEAYDVNTDNGQYNLLNVALRFDELQGEERPFALLQNTPNPFVETTTIGFILPETLAATLTIYDVSGRATKVIAGDYEAGYNEVTLDRSDLTPGVYYYRLETDGHIATKKMILIKE